MMGAKSNVNTKVDKTIHKQFSDLAGFLYPDRDKKDARNHLLEQVMKERIEKEKKK